MTTLIILADARDISLLREIPFDKRENCHVFLSNPFQKIGEDDVSAQTGPGKSVHIHNLSEYPQFSSPTQSMDVCTQVVLDKLGHLFDRRSENSETYLLDSQANMIALDMRPIASLAMTLCALIRELNPETVYMFGVQGRSLTLPQRPDISLFFRTHLFLNPIIEAICQDYGIKVVHHFSLISYLAPVANFIRDKMIGCFKFSVILLRLLEARWHKKPPNSSYKCAILIRSESEYSSARPILQFIEQHQEETGKALVIQDDIIKHPSARKILIKSGTPFLPIHTQISVPKMVMTWLKSSQVAHKAIKLCQRASGGSATERGRDQNEVKWALHFLSRPEIFSACVRSSLKASPEVLIFRKEIHHLVKAFDIKSLLTCDMIDKWSGAIGSLGQGLPLQTFTLQNASIFKMFLPKPNSTDHYFVASESARRALNHGHSENNGIIVTGLPMYEEWKKKCDDRPKKSWPAQATRKVVIGTQPFIGRHDLNLSLIRDTCECLQPEHNVTVQVKIHPREKKNDYQSFIQALQKENFPVVLLDQEALEDVFLEGDIYISRTSTTLLTSLYFQLFTLAYVSELSEYEWRPLDYLNEEAPLVLQNKKELSEQLAAILDDGPAGAAYRQVLLTKAEGVVDNNAGEQSLSATTFITNSLLDENGLRAKTS